MEIKNIDDDKLVVTYDCQTRGPSVRVNTRPGGSARAVHDIVNDYEKHCGKCTVCARAASAAHLGAVKEVKAS